MATLKVYGMNGLLEWHGIVTANGVKMKVDFTNGSVTAFGVAPATFATRNELTQFILENSDMYKSGRIRIVQMVQEDTPAEEEAPEQAPAEAEAQTQEYVEKKFACGDDAKAYLMEEHGFPISHLRNKSQMEAAAAQVGIKIVWG